MTCQEDNDKPDSSFITTALVCLAVQLCHQIKRFGAIWKNTTN